MQLKVWGYGLVQGVLIEPPCFDHEAADAMAVDAAAEFLFRHGKPCKGRGGCGICAGQQVVNELYGKNRKRFPGEEKRMNMLLSLEPLIYFESITNGKSI